MAIVPISTQTLQKTGTIIEKGLSGCKMLVKTVKYGPETSMVKKYGIKSIRTTKDSLIGFDDLCHESQEKIGVWRKQFSEIVNDVNVKGLRDSQLGKRLDITLEDGKQLIFHENRPDSSIFQNEYLGTGTTKERFSQLLEMLKVLKKA